VALNASLHKLLLFAADAAPFNIRLSVAPLVEKRSEAEE
jgi:hypothetical protein